MKDIHINQIQSPDWRRIRSIRLRSLADSPDAFSSTLAQDEARPDSEWKARLDQNDAAFFVATTNDDDDVGIAICAPYDRSENAAGLFGMWVAPEARGQRIGSSLVSTVVEWARCMSYKRIVLDVADANPAAVKLYESCGFEATGNISTLPPPREHITEHQRAVEFE